MYHARQVPGTEVRTAVLKDKYELDRQIGSGTFGNVSIARVRGSTKLVAVKTLRQSYECEPTRLREVQFYQAVPPHANLICLREMFLDVNTNFLNFVTELMDYNLLELIRKRNGRAFRAPVVSSLTTQLVRGLAHIHAHNFVHRDMKPENILVSIQGGHVQIKIADFGLARQIDAASANQKWTSYVATRWYRAPEQLLSIPQHTYTLDIWALGTMIAELCNLGPLFPGMDKVDMIRRHIRTLGSPSPQSAGGSWLQTETYCPEADELWKSNSRGTRSLVSTPQLKCFDEVIRSCLQWDPARRASLSSIVVKLKAIPIQKPPRKLSRYHLAVGLVD